MDFMNRLLQQLATFWGNLKGRQKFSMLTALTLVLAGLIGLVIWSNQISYSPMFTNLRPEQVPGIVDSLKQRKVPYRITYGGSVVEVPSDQVLDLRLSLASEGVIRDGMVGFEVFDNGGIGVTNFVERLNYQRALQGELMRTINELEAVESSRVHLVLPRDALFVSDQKPATASVVLKLRSGMRLTAQQVQGIVSLMSASVEGLTSDNISVVDTEGRTLHAQQESGSTAVSSSMLQYQESVERKLEERVVQFLERVVGPGKAIAKVQATLDLTSTEVLAEVYNPDGRVPRSEQNRSEVRKNVGPDSSGVPGTATNLPGNVNAATAGNGATSLERTEGTVNYEIDKTTSRSVQSPGQVKRLTVAVLIDGIYKIGAAATDGTAATSEYSARTADELKLFDQIIKNAVGFSEERGDEVTVSNMQFHRLEDDLPKAEDTIPWEKPTRYAMVVLGMLLVFLLVRPLLKSVADDVRGQAEQAAAAAGALSSADEAAALGGGLSPRMLTAGSQEKQRREEMINLARSDIDNTVQTVRDWLRTGTGGKA